jgi:hypothetical protein
VIEQAIVFMVAVSLPLMLVVEQITCWRSGLARSDHATRERDRVLEPYRERPGSETVS